MKMLKIHNICNAYPPMPSGSLEELGKDIQAHGLLDDIWVYEGQILDGRNRYLAAQKVGYDIPEDRFKEFVPETQGNPVEFVISRNHHRRHMGMKERVAVYIKLKEHLKETLGPQKKANVEWGKRRGLESMNQASLEDQKHPQVAPYPTGTIKQKAAEGAGLTNGSAIRVDYALTHGSPETQAALRGGKMSPTTAYRLTKEQENAETEERPVLELTEADQERNERWANELRVLVSAIEAFVKECEGPYADMLAYYMESLRIRGEVRDMVEAGRRALAKWKKTNRPTQSLHSSA